MRRIFMLIKREAAFLRGTIILIGLILAIFCAAFLSVVSVYFDVPEGLYNYFTIKSKRIPISITDVSLGEAEAFGENFVYGTKAGLTTDMEIKAKRNLIIEPFETAESPFTVNNSTYRAYAVTSDGAKKFEDDLGNIISEGRWFKNPGEIMVTKSFSTMLGGVKSGDKVQLGDMPFTVVGIYSGEDIRENLSNRLPPLCSFYICVDKSENMDFCYINHPTLKSMRADYTRLLRQGFDAVIPDNLYGVFENIDLCESLFGAIGIVLGIMVLFILYSLIAIFYRHRKAQICRLKLLGARNSTIAAVYCFIAVAIGLFAVTAGTGLSFVFNIFFMKLCTILFEQPFTPHFHFTIPLSLFIIISLFILILYFAFGLKIKNAQIAREIKHE